MKTNILGTTPAQYRKMLSVRIFKCIGVICLALLVNVLLTLFRGEENHTLFLLVNIAVDVIGSFFLIYYVSERILPQHRLYQLFLSSTSRYTGTVLSVQSATQRYKGIDCQLVRMDIRCFFLPVGFIELNAGDHVSIKTASNVILEVEQ